MGWNDHIDDSELGNLPLEAFLPFNELIEFDDNWLRLAEDSDQRIAVYEWFKARYCDPAMETPYISREGGYMFIHGGPFDPAEVIPDRFSGIVSSDVIDEVVEELHSEIGDEWAPMNYHSDLDYDPNFDLCLDQQDLDQQGHPDQPLMRLRQRIEQGYRVLSLDGDLSAKSMAEQLVFSSIITNLEAFLWETVDYWVRTDKVVLRNVVTKHEGLKAQPLKLGEIFEKHSSIDKHVIGFLQHVLWHRIEDVNKIYRAAFDIRLPKWREIPDAIKKRHDIIHRGGYDIEHQAVHVSHEEVVALGDTVIAFATEIATLVKASCDRGEAPEASGPPDF